MKNKNIPRKIESKSRRAMKSWSKVEKNHLIDDEVVPKHVVSMKPRTRDIQQRESFDESSALSGRVLASLGTAWLVEFVQENDSALPVFYECTPSRNIISRNPASTLLAVGDVVLFKKSEDEGTNKAMIMLVQERKTKLGRTGAGNQGIEQVIASNIEQAIIVVSAANPFYNRRLIDRYIISAELGELQPILCVNKIELMNEEFIRQDLAVYEAMGISTFLISAKNGQGLKEFAEILHHKISVFSGSSGVGKSTLVNYLMGGEVQITSLVSQKSFKGKHQTTFSKMFRLPHGGYVVDTPGIREFGLWLMEKSELALYFHDFDEFREKCRFMPCHHTHEPDCAIRLAVEEGLIDEQRYESYRNIYETLEK